MIAIMIVWAAPMMVWGFFGWRRWRQHYPGESWLGYGLRYATGKTVTEPHVVLFLLFGAGWLVWCILTVSVISEWFNAPPPLSTGF